MEFSLYTDGACKGNNKAGGGRGGWGASLQVLPSTEFPTGVVDEVFGGDNLTTNNQMELQAIIEGLKLLDRTQAYDRNRDNVVIYTDSSYAKNGIVSWMSGWRRRGWVTASGTPVKNIGHWRELDRLLSWRNFDVEWVKGHNGNAGNERADELANMGVPK